jgi:hypothetical protein
LPLAVTVHVRNAGDLNFAAAQWAGRAGNGLWIESFAVVPLETLTAEDIEYKGLTSTGIETPWLTNAMPCGSRGMGIPLVGFALRIRPQAAAAYDCQYSGYFQSGVIVGPCQNGAPCRSSLANDALEGIQIRLINRHEQASSAQVIGAASQPTIGGAQDSEEIGPRFGKLRQASEAAVVAEATKASPGRKKGRTAKSAGTAASKA